MVAQIHPHENIVAQKRMILLVEGNTASIPEHITPLDSSFERLAHRSVIWVAPKINNLVGAVITTLRPLW